MSAEQTRKRKDRKKKKDDSAPLLEDKDEREESGICAKIVFLILLSALGIAVGVIFFELGGVKSPLIDHGDVESATKSAVVEEPSAVPFDVPDATTSEPDDEPIEEVIDPSPPQKDLFNEPDAITTEEPEPAPVEEVVEDEQKPEEVSEIVQDDRPSEEIATADQTVAEVEPEVVQEQVAEEPTEPVEETIPVDDVPVQAEDNVAQEAVTEASRQTVPTEEITTESTTDSSAREDSEDVQEAVEQATLAEEASNFESQLESDTPEVPQESFIMRAEREAIQEAVDQVWVLAVRTLEELRALQTMAKSPLTYSVVDSITKRIEPLRVRLDRLVETTTENMFDGALEQAAELDRDFRGILNDLDEARTQDDALAGEAVQDEELEWAIKTVADELETDLDAEVLAESLEEELAAIANERTEEQVNEPNQEAPETAPELQDGGDVAEPVPNEAEGSVAQESVADPVAVALESVPDAQELVTDPTNAAPEVTEALNEEPQPFEAAAESVSPELIPEESSSPVGEPVAADSVQESQPEEVGQSQSEEPSSPLEVEEPIQEAKDAFVVGEPAEEVPASGAAAEEPSLTIQNFEEADRLVDQVK